MYQNKQACLLEYAKTLINIHSENTNRNFNTLILIKGEFMYPTKHKIFSNIQDDLNMYQRRSLTGWDINNIVEIQIIQKIELNG